MKHIYGIDLGTTYTKCGIVRPEDGVVRVFELDADSPGSPRNTLKVLRSAVSIGNEDGQRVAYVGSSSWHSFEQWGDGEAPYRRFEESKMWMGEALHSAYDAPPWEHDGWAYRPEDIGALVLRKVKREVENDRGPAMQHIVVTHPQLFTETRREATRQAAALAGLEVVETVTEPDAAAIAYRRYGTGGTFMVFDLGGGTLDVTIARFSPSGTEVLTSEGNRQGGREWDRMLFNRMVEVYQEKFPTFSGELLDDRTRQDWMRKAEQLKWQLSAPDVAPDARRGARIIFNSTVFFGMALHFQIRRAELEALTQPLVDDCRRCAELALAHKGLSWRDLEGILLVGGSTYLPAIRRMLTEASGGVAMNTSIDPSIAVAQGAALRAHEIAQRKTAYSMPAPTPTAVVEEGAAAIATPGNYTGALARGLGVRAWDAANKRNVIVSLVPKDSSIPVTKVRVFPMVRADQTSLEVELFEGEDRDPELCERIGTCVLTGLPAGPAGRGVEVTIRIDASGAKHILVSSQGRTKEEHIAFDPTRVIASNDLDDRRTFIESIQIR